MQMKLESMKHELEVFFRNNDKIQFDLKESRAKNANAVKQIENARKKVGSKEEYFSIMKQRLRRLNEFTAKDMRLIKQHLIGVYQDFVQRGSENQQQKSYRKKQATDQRDYFEKCSETLKTKIQKNQQISDGNFKRIMRENVDLINTLNDLKKLKQQREDFLTKLTQAKEEA